MEREAEGVGSQAAGLGAASPLARQVTPARVPAPGARPAGPLKAGGVITGHGFGVGPVRRWSWSPQHFGMGLFSLHLNVGL